MVGRIGFKSQTLVKGFQDTLQTKLTGLLDKLRQQCLIWIVIVSNHSHHQSRDVPWVIRGNDLSVEFVNRGFQIGVIKDLVL